MVFAASAVAALVLASKVAAAPTSTVNDTSANYSVLSGDNTFIVSMSAADAFPDALGDVSVFDIDVEYGGYESSAQSWLESLSPSTASTDEEKAQILTAAAYGSPFDTTNADMLADYTALLAAVAGNNTLATANGFGTSTTSALQARATNTFVTSAKHAVIWHTCASFFSCAMGVTCNYEVTPNSTPRDKCEKIGGQNCCISWSTTTVKIGFFKRTWNECNAEVTDEKLTKASCEGHGKTAGGDVCISNRAKGCT
ncbi:hypothetical protein Tdes44962_MAKER07288 [Teratosphaeria destructans]|uniref:WD-like domain-containing protein n=1 Tax=Teratosphaeria destructans TaxID=418781 RepID=A0A9W7SZM4_9PEZI|nr:hypothetical protein Tdes44962_MAKER07288 [Teratosphaeria destructans]